MADLNKMFVTVSGESLVTSFKGKYITPAEGAERDTAYDSKIVFLQDTGEIFTHGQIYGGTSAISALQTAIDTLNGADTVDGSVAKQVKDAINAIVSADSGDGNIIDKLEEIQAWFDEHEVGETLTDITSAIGTKGVEAQDASADYAPAVLYTYDEYKALDGNSEVTEDEFNALPADQKTKTAQVGTAAVEAVPATGLYKEIEDAKKLAISEGAATTEEIKIAGGPLADDISSTAEKNGWPADWKDEAGNMVIPEGKSLTEILTTLFLKVVNGTLGNPSYSTWSPSLSAPNAAVTNAGKTVEVGTQEKVTYSTTSTVSSNEATASISASQGYFDGDTYKSGNYSQKITGTTTGTATISAATWNGTAVENNANVTVKEGTNTLSVTQNGITAKMEANYTEKTIYASTNTKSKLSAVSKSVTTQTFTDKDLEKSTTSTITGIRYMFAGANTSAVELNSDNIRALATKMAVANTTAVSNSDDATGSGKFYINVPEGALQVIVAVPATKEVGKILDCKAYGTDLNDGATFVLSTVDVEGANGYTAASYKVYVYSPASALGANTYSIEVK